VKIPSVAYLGFSAETGELVDDHDIISVNTKNLYSSTAGNSNTDSSKGRNWGTSPKHNEAGSGGWFWFFFKFCLFGFAVVGLYAGFTFYRTSRGRSRF
jgi:mannose-binding lectin 2